MLSSLFTPFIEEHIERSSNVFRRESRIMEAVPPLRPAEAGSPPPRKTAFAFRILRAPDFLPQGTFSCFAIHLVFQIRKSQFFWDVLPFGAERRGCLLLIPPRGMKNELVVILTHQAIFPFTHYLHPRVGPIPTFSGSSIICIFCEAGASSSSF